MRLTLVDIYNWAHANIFLFEINFFCFELVLRLIHIVNEVVAC